MFQSLKSGLWVRALIRQMASSNIFATILHKGDEDAGAILIVLRDRDSNCVILRENQNKWDRSDTQSFTDTDDYLKRQTKYDPDLWILELDVDNISSAIEKTFSPRQLGEDVFD
ncbi:DUF1491 family protein [Swingsia samuiensis]|uniref:DUF1491 family protein n=1 Tax=Swingsia samuiensis TaxID=1293412 RepID=A0A4Y6UIU0_9PROT|nr:DUF1491 family protein [Swingsia samuiensis]QDH16740.1 DUF1491 family protein [Swingsia samuiensis]